MGEKGVPEQGKLCHCGGALWKSLWVLLCTPCHGVTATAVLLPPMLYKDVRRGWGACEMGSITEKDIERRALGKI